MNVTHGLRRALQINPNGLASVFGNRRRHWREIGERVPRLAAGTGPLLHYAGLMAMRPRLSLLATTSAMA